MRCSSKLLVPNQGFKESGEKNPVHIILVNVETFEELILIKL